MRFWITKNGELPVREQLVRQVVLGILSEDLPVGSRLPSIRAFARRHNIHPNTVSSAYHDLLQRGWLEMRRGSGVFIKKQPTTEDGSELDALLAETLRTARARGFEPEEVLDRLEQLVRPRRAERVIIAEPDEGLREIIAAEARECWGAAVESMEPQSLKSLGGSDNCLVAALASRNAAVRQYLPHGVPLLTLRMTSVRKSLEGQVKPPPEAIVAVASRSLEFRTSTRTVLLAVGLHPDCVSEIDATLPGWKERLTSVSMVIADVVAAGEMPSTVSPRVFRMLAPESVTDLQRFKTAR